MITLPSLPLTVLTTVLMIKHPPTVYILTELRLIDPRTAVVRVEVSSNRTVEDVK